VPSDVTDTVIAHYAEALVEESIVKHPHELHRLTVKGWNKAADMIAECRRFGLLCPPAGDATSPCPGRPSRPRLSRRSRRTSTAVPRSPISSTTIIRVRSDPRASRRDASSSGAIYALTLAGRPPETLTSLKAVVELTTIKAGLRVLIEHHGGKPAKDVFDLACFLKSIARRRGAPADELAALTCICAKLRPQHRGLTPKNRERLRPFDDPHNVEALLSLAERLVAEVERGGGRRRADASSFRPPSPSRCS